GTRDLARDDSLPAIYPPTCNSKRCGADLAEPLTIGLCHGNERWPDGSGLIQSSCCCDSVLPLRRCLGSEDLQGRPGDEMALKVERVVDGGMHIEKALGRASRLEPLHFLLSPSYGLVGILDAIVPP